MTESEIKNAAARAGSMYFELINEGIIPKLKDMVKENGLPNDIRGILLGIIAKQNINASTDDKNTILLYARKALFDLYGIK